MTCNNINFTVDLIEATENQAVIKVTAEKYYECITVKVALYNKDDELLQDFSNEADLNNTISAIINVPINSEVCKIRVRVIKCCPNSNCDPSTIVCDPGLVLDPGSCLCVEPPRCPKDPVCNVEPCLWNSTIKGYVFYSDNLGTINVPNIGELNVPCFGGHICDATVFMPKLRLQDGTIITANKTVSVNNWQGLQSPTPVPGWTPQSNYDRSDIFEFNVEDTTNLVNAEVFLDCSYNSCHNGSIVVALVGYCDELKTHKLMFFSCLGSSQIDAKPMFYVECNASTYVPCDPPPSPSLTSVPPQPTPSLSDFYCAAVSTSEEDCAPKEPVTDPYIKLSDKYINQPFNDVYIPRRVNLNISQNGCDVVARFCAISCRDGIPPSASPSPTPSVTPTSTPTPTPTPTPSVTPTQTPTPSITPSPCASPSVTPSVTPTRTPTRTPTPSPSVTRTPTPTPSTSTVVGCMFDYMPYVSLSELPILGNITNKIISMDIDMMCHPRPDQWDLNTYYSNIGITSSQPNIRSYKAKPSFDARYTLFQLFMEPRSWRPATGYKEVKLNINGKSYDNQSLTKIDGSPIPNNSYLFIGNFTTAEAVRYFAKNYIDFGPGWPYNDLHWIPAVVNKPYFSPTNVVYCIIVPC